MELKELATPDKVFAAFVNMFSYLPDPDTLMRNNNLTFPIFREMLTDPHISAVTLQRFAGVLAYEWTLDRRNSKSRESKFITEVLENLDVNEIINNCLEAIHYGFVPFEITWGKTQDGKIYPESVTAKPQEWFVFGKNKQLRLKTIESPLNGVEVPENKFLIARHKPTYLNPYGQKTLSKVFWPLKFKKAGIKFWMLMIEKYGMPFLIGEVPRGSGEKAKVELLEDLNNMVQDGIAVVPEGTKVAPMTTNSGVSAAVYERIAYFLNSEISKAYLGNTLAVEIGNTGAYGSAKAHTDSIKTLFSGDKKIVERFMNELIKMVVNINFGSNAIAPRFSLEEKIVIDTERANRDSVLQNLGVKFKKSYFIQNYGLADEDFEYNNDTNVSDLNNKTKSLKPNETDKKDMTFSEFKEKVLTADNSDKGIIALDDFMNNIDNELIDKSMQKMIKPIFDLMNKSNDFNEVLDGLSELYPELTERELFSYLEKSMFIAEIIGKIAVKEELER